MGYREVLRNRRFVLYLGMTAADNVGYSLSIVSILWLAYQGSGGLFAPGIVLFLQSAVWSCTFLFGPLVDRARNKRSVFVGSYAVQAAAAAVLVASIGMGIFSFPLLFLLVVVISATQDISWAGTNVAPRLLLSTDEMFAAQGLSGAISGGNAIAGYAAGAALIVLVGVQGGLLAYAGLLVLATVLALPLSIPAPWSRQESLAASFRGGWRILSDGHPRPLLQLALVDAVRGLWINAPALLITLLASKAFPDPAASYGALFTAYVVGQVSADLILGRWNPRKSVGAILLFSLFATAGGVLLAVMVPPFLLGAVVSWFAVGVLVEAYYDAKYAFLRGAVPPEALGRVSGNLYLFPGITGAIGAVVLGSLASSLPAPVLAGWVAGGFVLAGSLGLALPSYRRLSY